MFHQYTGYFHLVFQGRIVQRSGPESDRIRFRERLSNSYCTIGAPEAPAVKSDYDI